RTTLRSPLFPAERDEYEAELARVRAVLGDDAFDVQWRIGASNTLERALEEAREALVPTAVNHHRHFGASHV
ncbi:MAG: hypothetical protein WBW76_15915, partial [Candidatus Cybelea sp.]